MINNVIGFHLKKLCQIENRTKTYSNIVGWFHDWTVSKTNKSKTRRTAMNKQKEKMENKKISPGGKKVKPGQTKVPSTVNIVVIGTGGPGTSHSLLVTTETTRYMFNCGEGTQRLAAMSKGLRAAAFAKLSGLENIFITHKSWENTGGLLGLSMTLESQLNPESKVYMNKKGEGQSKKPTPTSRSAQVTIHGPPGVEKIALMAKKFSESANLDIVKSEKTFSDAALSVQAMPFYEDFKEEPLEHESEPVAKKSKSNEQCVPETSVAYAYICQPKPALGKINVEKCLDAGITIGPMVGTLQRGETVTLDDGTVVKPEQVLDVVHTEKRPFLVIQCPSLKFMQSLKSHGEISRRMASPGEDSFALVIHMSPQDVYKSEEYQAWLKRFSESTKHLILNRSADEADLIRVRTHQAMLNLVSQEVFPILPSASVSTLNGTKNISSESTLFASPGMHYVYRGKDLGFQFSSDDFDHAETQKSCLNDIELRKQLEELKQAQNQPDTQEKNYTSPGGTQSSYPSVVFLGTGSSEPNRIRGQSCIVVQLSEDTVIILDCGEDSYGQLHRFYGGEEAKRILQKVKAIFVSHMHGDHHLGLFTLLKERRNAFAVDSVPFSPVLLLAPIQMRRWLRFYHHEMESLTHLLRFVKHQVDLKTFDDNFNLPSATIDDVKQELQLEEYKPVAVVHCNNAFGVAFKHRMGVKMVYSGDTRPCDNLVEAGMECDILIHEATHEDALIAHAKASKHSTFSEAMEIGSRMRAKHVILTHFSQRYPHMVPFFDMKLPENVGIAFDNMQVCPRTLNTLPKLIPPLTTLFSEKLQYLEVKRIKRTREQTESQAQQHELPAS